MDSVKLRDMYKDALEGAIERMKVVTVIHGGEPIKHTKEILEVAERLAFYLHAYNNLEPDEPKEEDSHDQTN